MVQIIKSYDEALKARGIRFIFLPIPEKKIIFHNLLNTPKPLFLGQVIEQLKKEGVEVINTQKAFEEAYQRNQILLYQRDDTHWSAEGVKLTAKLIQKVIY